MADALVSIPLQIALEKIAPALGEQMGLFAGAASELQKIRNTLHSIEAVLHDAESKQFAEERVRVWLLNLKAIAHEIEDVLDEWRIFGLEEDGNENDIGRNKVCTCLTSPYACFDRSISRYKVARQVKEIRKRLDQIASDKLMCSFSTNSSSGGETVPAGSRPQTSSLMEESRIMGRVEDKETLISRLLTGSRIGDADVLEIHVTAIVGIGGLGKTTLARLIYHDAKVKDHFNQALYWVCVSDVFDVIRLTKAILQEVKKQSSTSSYTELNSLQNELLESLKGKRFLLVLDDVWNNDSEKWEMLQLSLKSGAQGSKILVTTRSEKVANIMNADYIYELKGLSDEDSQKLFNSKAFAGRKAGEYSELESIGREIGTKCKGVPLSIKVIGSAMNSKRTRVDWQNILDSEMWSLPQVKDKILPALLLSYYNLPPHLKQCFKYCSIYEKNELMQKDQLVKLWVVQGFIQPQGNRAMEDIAEEYFNDLVACSMLQQVMDIDSMNIACQMHDLLHDLAEFITKDERFIFSVERPKHECSVDVRRASSFSSKENASSNLDSCRAKKLRTIFVQRLSEIDSFHDNLFRQARFLRVLLFKDCQIKKLPKSIENLKHLRYVDLSGSELKILPNAFGKMKLLRYLDLSYTYMVELPESVSHLINLHTLNLNHCGKLQRLPKGMGEMASLRHLEIENTYSLEHLPKGLGRIHSLQSLSKFIVGEGRRGCGIDELQRLNSLKGTLLIDHLERVASQEEARKAELWNKPHLSKLILWISSVGDVAEKEKVDHVLECLQPHANLEELQLHCEWRPNLKLPSWVEDPSFTKLTVLFMSGLIHHEENVLGLGKLRALKSLTLSEAGVKKMGDEFYYGFSTGSDDVGGNRGVVAFPKLERLVLEHLFELEEWGLTMRADELKVMPSLRQLIVVNCPKLPLLPPHLAAVACSIELTIEDCKRMKGVGCSFPLENLALGGDVCEFFSSGLPDLPNLVELKMYRLRNEELPNEGWGKLVALQKLELGDCVELKSLPDGLALLQSLEHLRISYCQELDSLPEQLGQLKKLKSLKLESANALTSLPNSLAQLESLECLALHRCLKLESLPLAFQQPPLTQLLDIMYCPLLPEKYRRKG